MVYPKVHEGRNVKRFREMMGIKQEKLVADLGEDWNQKRISVLESKEKIEDALLAEIATWDAIDLKPGWSVVRGRVYVKNSDGVSRVYDGVAVSPSKNNIGIEVKSGNATKTASQREFDELLNELPANKATGVGKNKGLIVNRAKEIKTN